MAEKTKTEKAKAEQTNNSNVEEQIKAMLDDAKAEAEKIVADTKAEAGKIVDDAKAEAEKIVASAKAYARGEKTEEQIKAEEDRKAYYNELVEIELFKDSGKYKDDVFVAVNGVGCLIQRGKKVKVKRKYALALENSMNQDKKTSELIDIKIRELEKAESKM